MLWPYCGSCCFMSPGAGCLPILLHQRLGDKDCLQDDGGESSKAASEETGGFTPKKSGQVGLHTQGFSLRWRDHSWAVPEARRRWPEVQRDGAAAVRPLRDRRVQPPRLRAQGPLLQETLPPGGCQWCSPRWHLPQPCCPSAPAWQQPQHEQPPGEGELPGLGERRGTSEVPDRVLLVTEQALCEVQLLPNRLQKHPEQEGGFPASFHRQCHCRNGWEEDASDSCCGRSGEEWVPAERASDPQWISAGVSTVQDLLWLWALTADKNVLVRKETDSLWFSSQHHAWNISAEQAESRLAFKKPHPVQQEKGNKKCMCMYSARCPPPAEVWDLLLPRVNFIRRHETVTE